jgi:hypothetical protein
MNDATRTALIGAAIAVQLLASGCLGLSGGDGSASSLFGDDSDSSSDPG